MEAMRNHHTESTPGYDDWDAVPRDGPWVYVVDVTERPAADEIRRGWVPFDSGPRFIEHLTELLGRTPGTDDWAIIDQTNLGPRMVPENFDPDEAAVVSAEHQTEGQR